MNTSHLKILTDEEKRDLLQKTKAGDEKARGELIYGNLRLVLSIVQRFSGRRENMDDLFQVGCIGLVKAVDNFNLDLDVKFSTYAVPMIIGEIRRYLRDNNAIRISRSVRDLAYRSLQAREELIAIKQGEPTVEEIAARLGAIFSKNPNITKKCPLGINIGKSKITPLEEAAQDYLFSFNALADYADFFVINVSSPNTPELRKLQGADFLPSLLGEISKANEDRSKKLGVKRIPIVLKIAPDLSFGEIDSILSILFELGLDGICATNTTITRPEQYPDMEKGGGMSGAPLFKKSLGIIKYISQATNGKLPIIGVGGIVKPEDAGEMMNAGASLVQLYTGMIYRGPFFARSVASALEWRDKEWL